jgi:hypothetical protein
MIFSKLAWTVKNTNFSSNPHAILFPGNLSLLPSKHAIKTERHWEAGIRSGGGLPTETIFALAEML